MAHCGEKCAAGTRWNAVQTVAMGNRFAADEDRKVSLFNSQLFCLTPAVKLLANSPKPICCLKIHHLHLENNSADFLRLCGSQGLGFLMVSQPCGK